MRRFAASLVTALGVLFGAAIPVLAQTVNSSAVTSATVVGPTLTVTKTQDLAFGTIIQGGASVTVTANASNAAKWFLFDGGQNFGRGMTWTFGVSALSDGSGHTLPAPDLTGQGCWNNSTGAPADDPCGSNFTFNPQNPYAFPGDAGSTYVVIGVGGVLAAPTFDVNGIPSAPAGTYTGTLTFTAAGY